MYTLVLIRHGESTWNLQDRFTGWSDVDLTHRGIVQARAGGEHLKRLGFEFDIAYTSVLKRCIRSQWLILETMDRCWVPIVSSWRLNERHYGALTGLNKTQTAIQYGETQVHLWRRSFTVRPPALTVADSHAILDDPRYASLKRSEVPLTESLKDTVVRVLPFWHSSIAPTIRSGKRVIINAHGNSMRALIKYLDGISDEAITGLHIPNGVPIVYELDDELKPLRRYDLAIGC